MRRRHVGRKTYRSGVSQVRWSLNPEAAPPHGAGRLSEALRDYCALPLIELGQLPRPHTQHFFSSPPHRTASL